MLAAIMKPSAYYDPDALQRETSAERHRDAIGGLWDELGELQLQFLRDQGMQPHHRLLDIGCGALRLGVRAIDYLNPQHYFGSDISPELVDAGYQQELSDAQREKCSRESQFLLSHDFDFSALPEAVDFAIAQSVFTHLPLNHIRHCLARLVPHLVPGGVFYATAWLLPDDMPLDEPYVQPGTIGAQSIISTAIADPYHYHAADFAYMIRGLPYTLEVIGEWGHSRGQQMLAFIRV